MPNVIAAYIHTPERITFVYQIIQLEKKLEFLPDCVSTTVSLLHYCVWVTRDTIDPRDYFDMVSGYKFPLN